MLDTHFSVVTSRYGSRKVQTLAVTIKFWMNIIYRWWQFWHLRCDFVKMCLYLFLNISCLQLFLVIINNLTSHGSLEDYIVNYIYFLSWAIVTGLNMLCMHRIKQLLIVLVLPRLLAAQQWKKASWSRYKSDWNISFELLIPNLYTAIKPPVLIFFFRLR